MAGKYRNLYYIVNKYIFRFLPDTLYHNLLGWIHHRRFGVKYHWMNIKHPTTYNEKIQWMKKNGPVEVKRKLADKFDCRETISKIIGRDHLIDLLPLNSSGALYITDVAQLDWDKLPDRFVLKMTKGSGFNIICSDKSALDKETVLNQLQAWLKVDNYLLSREPHYKGENKIIAERFLESNIVDYKFFCFDGEPKIIKTDVNRFSDHRANYYDANWNFLPIDEGGCVSDENAIIPKPLQFKEMLAIVRKLTKDWPFVRIDLYLHENKIYFGEMTFHPAGGYAPISPFEWQKRIGEMIRL